MPDPDDKDNKGGTPGDQTKSFTEDEVKTMISEAVKEAVKDIKVKLDNAYSERDIALDAQKAADQKAKQAEIDLLKEQGKHKEAHDAELAAERSRREAAEKKNLELTRDNILKTALSGYEFRSKKSADMAFKEIVNDLVQTEDGNWTHKDGSSIEDAVKGFSEDESYAFLFKVKASTGSGTDNFSSSKPSPDKPTSVFKMKQADVLKAAEEGRLPHQRQ